MNELLQKLTEAVGVAGDEKEVRLLIRDLIKEHVDEWQVDPMGNLIALKKGNGKSNLKVMLDAHMDEVGLIIKDVDGNGTYMFGGVGGLDDRVLLGKAVQVGKKKTPGVIGARPVHLLKSGEWTRTVPMDSMRIDIGASGKEAANGHAKAGDKVAFLTNYEEHGRFAWGKAFDDRVGCALLIEMLKKGPFDFDLYCAFTVQEEVGLRGAITAAYQIKPDIALVLDCTPALDLPTTLDESPNVSLGQGPAIYVMDKGSIQSPRLVSYIIQTAQKHHIPYQIRRPGGGGTNTASIQRSAGGVMAATVSVPGRYLHAPISMINLEDYQHTLNLVEQFLRELTPALVQYS